MDQLLDLSITLASPPPGTPSDIIASMDMRCDPLGLAHTGDLLTDPLTGEERESLRWYLEDYWKWPYEQFLRRGRQIEDLLVDLGERLYKRVFESREANNILQAWRLSSAEQRRISILSTIPRALSLPWELLCDEQGFLVLRTRNPVSIVRRLPQSELATLSTTFVPPLRVLLVTARPEGAGFVDPRGIARELVEEMEEQVQAGAIELEFLRPPTLHALRKRLGDSKRPPIHLLHFDGHGTFSEEVDEQDGLHLSGGEQGMLAFENDEGKLALVKAEDVAQVLQDSGVRLAMLTACQSAMSSADDAFSSIAARLIKGGVDAVVAMSASVLVASATRYVEAFYNELAMGTPVPTAQERARQALYDDPRRHVHRRKRDEEGKPVELRDWWMPHFYQQRPLKLQATKKSGRRNKRKQQSDVSVSRLNETMPVEPRYGFSGRARELLKIERCLLQGKLVAIHGFGGIGKTAFVREAADWLTRTKMYERACFVSFEHGGDAASLLSVLGKFMGVYDGSYNPNETKAALARIKKALKEQPTMVIADNLESILPDGNASLEIGLRMQLWDVLLELVKMDAGVLLTSRDTSFGDGRLAPGRQVAHLQLLGLFHEDAYAFAIHLLDDLGIDRERAPYAELRDLLAQLDHHPLAIQLVLPTLRKLSLSKIRADFAALLPKFEDDTITGRNRSLLASLDYSWQRLSEEQQALLARLAPFEGGANEKMLLTITEIPENIWGNLQPTLEQTALVIVEPMHDAIPVPFLRFHPVLMPFLRGQSGTDDAALLERYAQSYFDLANRLFVEDIRNTRAARVLIRQELPNLRHALKLLLEAGKLEDAANMANSITKFLNHFGLWRERDKIRQQIAEAVTSAVTQAGERLTLEEYLRENDLGEDEMEKGDLGSAYIRFTSLLERIEVQPEGTKLGRDSYSHCLTLGWLARCLRKDGKITEAKERLHDALAIIDALISLQPDDQGFLHQRAVLLGELGDVLRDRGQYQQAREAYEEGLRIANQQGYLRQQSIALEQLGRLAFQRADYVQSRSYYTEALESIRELDEPVREAVVWHELGMIAYVLALGWHQIPRDAQRDGNKEAMWEKGGTKGVKPL
jgi:tetratricopeptide (TPR) repeat protein